jgi:hypothetical protein
LISKDQFQTNKIEDQIKIVESVLASLDSISKKGYLASTDLRDFPIVSDFLPFFLYNSNSNSKEFINGVNTVESYKWIYNIVILSLYLLTIDSLNCLNLEDVEPDLISSFKNKADILLSRVDSSIQHHMRKQGIRISQNSYLGFDTEFNQIEMCKNKLISAQLAISSKLQIKLPLNQKYTLSMLDVESNKLHRVKNTSDEFNYKKVETSIQYLIQQIRSIKFGCYDENMTVLAECLKEIRGMSYCETNGSIIFTVPNTPIQPYICFNSSFSLKELMKVATSISTAQISPRLKTVLQLIKTICSRNYTLKNGKDNFYDQVSPFTSNYAEIEDFASESEKCLVLIKASPTEFKDSGEKRLSRLFIDLFLASDKVCITTTKNYYLISHLTQADLSMLSDFETIKENLSIVNGSFVTLRDPLKFNGQNIHIRDTMLLSPAGSKSLGQIGKMYKNYPKIEIAKDEIEDMQRFLNKNYEKFIEYAIRDAIISLVHALWMEEFNFSLGGIGVPLSLSSVGRRYVKNIWDETHYPGYQVSKYSLGDVESAITPKGLNSIKQIGLVLPYYIANYKGGRNECFMYGIDSESVWYDYDLVSAYTTVMAAAGHPDYEGFRKISIEELLKFSDTELLYNYLIIQTDFEFPCETKYPSIPCFVDDNCTIFPLTGHGVLTGSEYLLARNQGCKFKIGEIFLIPFNKDKDIRPFDTIIQKVQEARRDHPKGSISNLMYKEIGNSIYGSVVRGMSDKRKFDIQSNSMQRLKGDDLSNPIIASWTTAFIRSIIGESLHSIQKQGGKIVSVTTDGFITDFPNLDRIPSTALVTEFKKMRKFLSGDETCLELKNSGKGIMAWTTRGQLGLDSNIRATTGFQHNIYNKENLVHIFEETFKSETKTIEYIQSRLRSAKEVFKNGGHVTMLYRDQQFRMHFDNKRVLHGARDIDFSLLDSKPLNSVQDGETRRYLARLTITKQYSKYSNPIRKELKYKKVEDVAVLNFVKGLIQEPPMFNLHRVGLGKNKDIVSYLKSFNPKIKLSENSIAALKKRPIKLKSIPKSKESINFVEYLRQKFKDFDHDSFFRL